MRASLEAGTTDNVTCIVVDVVEDADVPDHQQPMLVGAAADLKRRAHLPGVTGLFRGHRAGDTGELEPVRAEIPDSVPFAIETDPVDPEQARYAPRPPRRFLWTRRLLATVAALGVVWMLGAAAYSWTQQQYYVGEHNGTVTIYRGLNADLAGRSASPSPTRRSNVTLDRLSDYDASTVREGIDAASLDDARTAVRRLAANQTLVDDDQPAPPSATPPPTATPTPSREPVRPRRALPDVRVRVGVRSDHGVRAPPSAGRRALPARAGAGGRHRRLRRRGLGVEQKVPADILAYGGWLAGLVVVAHLVVRFVAPYADPVLLPVVAALNGLGLAVIHRLDLAEGTTFARQQLTWMTLGVGLFVVTLLVLRDHRVLQRFTYTSGLAAIFLLLLPMVPGLGATINGSRIWIHLGPFSFQPGEVAKLLLVITFAGYLVLHRDALALAGRRVLFVDLPRGRDLGPILLMWLISLGILVFQRDLGSSLLFFGLFLIMLYVATERAGWLLVGAGLFLAGALLAYQLFDHVRVRVETWLHPFELLRRRRRREELPARRVDVRDGLGRAARPRLRQRHARADPARRVRLHHRRHRRGARPDRRDRGDRALRPDRRARPAGLADLPRRLRQADGRRPRQRGRPAGVRGHRRRHPADPADRSHHAVPVVRRLLAGRQLGDDRAVAAHLATRPAAPHPSSAPTTTRTRSRPRW